MVFDAKRLKGVIDRSFIPVKVPLHKESTRTEVHSKCTSQVINGLWIDTSDCLTFSYVSLDSVLANAHLL